jgi:hypothetical protein
MKNTNRWLAMSTALWLTACTADKGGDSEGDGTTAGASSSGTTDGTSGDPVTTGASSTSGGITTGGTTTAASEGSGGGESSSSDATSPESTTGWDTGASSSSSTSGETTSAESSSSAGPDDTTDGGLVVDCNGCTCDAAISYCQVVSSPTLDPPKEHPDGPCPFIEAGVYDYGCVLYPQDCGGTADCACVPDTQPVCGCMDAGDWLMVNCDYP